MLKTNLGQAGSPKEVFKDFYLKYAKDIKEEATKKIVDIDGNIKYIYHLNKGNLSSISASPYAKCIHYDAVEKYVNDKLVYTAKIIHDKFEYECYYYNNGKKHIEIHYDSNGVLNRTSGPSIIFYNEDGSICQEEFWIAGKQQLVAESFSNCNITSTNFDIDGQEVCIQIVTAKKEGNPVIDEKSLVKNKLHSINGSPSIINRNFNGKEVYRAFHKEGKLHSFNNSPSVISCNFNGEEIYRAFHKEGKLHNTNGPAEIFKSINNISTEVYWIEGKKMSKEEYEKNRILNEEENLNDKKSNLKEDLKKILEGFVDKEVKTTAIYPGSLSCKINDHNGILTKTIIYPEKTVIISFYKKETFNKDNKLHSFNDEPAVVYFVEKVNLLKHSLPNIIGKKEWWKNGKRHRDEGFAVEYFSGLKEYWFEGKDYSKADYEKIVKYNDSLKEIQDSLKNIIGDTVLSTKTFVDNFKDYRVETVNTINYHYLNNILFRKDYLNDDGEIAETIFLDEKGKISSPIEGFPAVIYMREDGSFENVYYKDGNPIVDGIRKFVFDSDMNLKSSHYYEKGNQVETHFFNKKGEIEACNCYDDMGYLVSKASYNETHMKSYLYNKENKVESIVKINKNLLLDGVGALQIFDKNQALISYSSYKNGFYHCYDGKPSVVEYQEDRFVEKYIEVNNYITDKPSIVERSNKDNLDILKEHFTDITGKIIKTIDYTKKNDFKSEITSAGYRVAANQVSKGVKHSILLLMQNKGMENSKLKHLEDVLDSEIGNALISVSIGYILSMDKFKNNNMTTKLAKEFRVEGMTIAGDVFVDSVVNYILPNIINETEKQSKFRIEENKELNENNNVIEDLEKKDKFVNETI